MITITNPAEGPSTPAGPSNPAPNKLNPEEKRKEFERKRLQLQLQQQKQKQQQTQQKLKTLQPKQSLSGSIKSIAFNMIKADDPNDDPMALFAQVRPLISKMGMLVMVVPDKTELILGKTQAKNSNYCILLRRKAEIASIIIDRIKRVEKNLDRIIWDSAGIKMYVWWPYIAPAQPGAPTPAGPAGPA